MSKKKRGGSRLAYPSSHPRPKKRCQSSLLRNHDRDKPISKTWELKLAEKEIDKAVKEFQTVYVSHPFLVLVLPLWPLAGARPHPRQALLGHRPVRHRHRRLQADPCKIKAKSAVMPEA